MTTSFHKNKIGDDSLSNNLKITAIFFKNETKEFISVGIGP